MKFRSRGGNGTGQLACRLIYIVKFKFLQQPLKQCDRYQYYAHFTDEESEYLSKVAQLVSDGAGIQPGKIGSRVYTCKHCAILLCKYVYFTDLVPKAFIPAPRSNLLHFNLKQR